MKTKILALALGLAMAVGAQAASASTVLATYYKATPGGDFEKICCRTTIEVGATLGTNGLPVYDSAATLLADPINGETLIDIDGQTNEIKWWTPDGSHIVQEGTFVVPLPFSDNSLFPTNGGGGSNGGSNGFQTVRLSAFFKTVAPNTLVTFNISADDDVFVFVNGQYVDSILDGIHGNLPDSFSTTVGQGLHKFDLFYADRHTVGANLNVDVQGATLTAMVPEPGTWALMIMGFGGAGAMIRRRRSLAAAA